MLVSFSADFCRSFDFYAIPQQYAAWASKVIENWLHRSAGLTLQGLETLQ